MSSQKQTTNTQTVYNKSGIDSLEDWRQNKKQMIKKGTINKTTYRKEA